MAFFCGICWAATTEKEGTRSGREDISGSLLLLLFWLSWSALLSLLSERE